MLQQGAALLHDHGHYFIGIASTSRVLQGHKLLKETLQSREIEIRCHGHGIAFSVGLEHKRQVQHSTRVTAIHD